MNKNKIYTYLLFCLTAYNCIASDSELEKEAKTRALISFGNPPQQQLFILLSPQLGDCHEEVCESLHANTLSDQETASEQSFGKEETSIPLANICQYCNKSFTRKENLTKHILTHTNQRPFACEICNKSFNQLDHLKKHKRTHTGEKPFTCKICKRTFADSGSQARHQRSKKGCQLWLNKMRAAFKDDSAITKLSDQANTSEPSKKIVAIAVQEQQESEEDSPSFNFSQFPTFGLKKFRKNAASTAIMTPEETECGKTFTPQSNDLTQQMRTKSYECILCGESFAQLSDLKSHFTPMSNCWLQLKRTRAAFKDDFSIAKSLDQADASEPSTKIVAIEAPESESEFTVAASGGTSVVNNEPYEIKDLFCQFKTCECKNEFESSELLKEHIQKKHSQFKNVCEICGKSFADKGHLKIHIRTHTGEKPYKCTIDKCDWTFSDQGNLRKHINSIHKGDKSYRCTSCNKSFAKKQALQRHQASKTGCLLQLKRTHRYASEVNPSASRQTDSLKDEYSSKSSGAEEDTETEE